MFTGLISDIGELTSRDGGRLSIRSRYGADTIALGTSIACDGCCLTVTRVVPEAGGCVFSVDVSNETLAKTTMSEWLEGRKINLERALKAGDEIGGHLVTGHVDGVARILAVEADGDSRRFDLKAPGPLARFIAPKGSVALDGISLTVNEVAADRFGINLIPQTLTMTTWGSKRSGDAVNLEIDPLARYVARLMEYAPC